MKQTIQLTESGLKGLIRETIEELQNEYADALDGIENDKMNYENHFINHGLRVVEYGDKVFILFKGKVVGEFDDYYQTRNGNVYAYKGDTLTDRGYVETYYIDTKGNAHLLTKEYPDGRVEQFEKEPGPKRYFGGRYLTKSLFSRPPGWESKVEVDKSIDKETGLHRNTPYIMGDGVFKEKHKPSQKDLHNPSFNYINEAISRALKKVLG